MRGTAINVVKLRSFSWWNVGGYSGLGFGLGFGLAFGLPLALAWAATDGVGTASAKTSSKPSGAESSTTEAVYSLLVVELEEACDWFRANICNKDDCEHGESTRRLGDITD